MGSDFQEQAADKAQDGRQDSSDNLNSAISNLCSSEGLKELRNVVASSLSTMTADYGNDIFGRATELPKIDFNFDPKFAMNDLSLKAPDAGNKGAQDAGAKDAKPAEAKAEKADKTEGTTDKTEGTTDNQAAKDPAEKQKELLEKMKKDKPDMKPEEEEKIKQDLEKIAKLPEAQRDKIFASMDKILSSDTTGTTKLTDAQREEIASSLAHQIAHPEDIRQGNKATCVAANAEKTMAMTHPERYADMVEKLSVDGKYTIKMPDGSEKTIEAQKDEKGQLMGKTDSTGERSYASEVFQNFAMNIPMEKNESYKSYVPGTRESRNEKDKYPDGVKKDNDSGERHEKSDPWFWEDKMNKFGGLEPEQKEVMFKALFPGDMYEDRPIDSAEDLKKAFKDNGDGPLNVGVVINDKEGKFLGMGNRDGGAGNHAVVITHIEEGPPTLVYFENTVGGTPDHSYPKGQGVPIDDFVKAMKVGNRKAQVRTGCDTQ